MIPDEHAGSPFHASPRVQVLFVCSGNTCRSPLAAAILAGLTPPALAGHVEIASAGTGAANGAEASGEARACAREHGVSLDAHRSRRLCREMVTDADLVLVMERRHFDAVLALARSAADRTHLLTGFAAALPPGEGKDVVDPMGGGPDAYRRAFETIHAALTRSFPRIAALAEEGAP